MWGSKLIPLITFERQAELWAPSPVIRASICIYQYLCYSLTLRDLVPPLTFRCLYYDARKKKNHWNTIAQLQVWAQTHFHLHPPPTPHPPGPIERLILAGVVCKWKGGHHPQHAPSLDPCQPYTSALICSSFWAAGTGGSHIKRLIPIDLSAALSLALHLMVDGAPDWNRAAKTRRGWKQPRLRAKIPYVLVLVE